MPICPQLFNAAELAPQLNTTPEKLMDLHRRGLIPSVKTSHRVYFNLDAVVKALRDRTAPATEGASR